VACAALGCIHAQNWSYVSKPNQLVRSAHEVGNETTSLSFSQDGNMLLSRNMEGTLKLWDLRKWVWLCAVASVSSQPS
jgi:WD40 repeat protein